MAVIIWTNMRKCTNFRKKAGQQGSYLSRMTRSMGKPEDFPERGRQRLTKKSTNSGLWLSVHILVERYFNILGESSPVVRIPSWMWTSKSW